MFKHIKKIYSDLTEFFLVLLTGLFAGSIFTLAYVKYNVKTTLSFADIGGMLAGIGTIGLLVLAWFTADSWKRQQDIANKYRRLDEFHDQFSDALAKLARYHNVVDNLQTQTSKYEEMEPNSTEAQTKKDQVEKLKNKISELWKDYNESANQLYKICIKLDIEFMEPDLTMSIHKMLRIRGRIFTHQLSKGETHPIPQLKKDFDILYNKLYTSLK
jgi:uncharacterized membrane-anchored protein YhcB (DUF1043 family)